MSKKFKISELPLSDRPRERLLHIGSESLSSQELLALILGKGVRGESVLMTSYTLLHTFGSLEHVLAASLEDLQKLRGVGIAKATQLKACLEISRRIHTQVQSKKRSVVFKSADVYELVRDKIAGKSKEHFVVVSFDIRNGFIGMDIISVGILNASLIHPRETFEVAIRNHAAQIILCHNHPSGVCDPSDEDVEITKRLCEAGNVLGITVLDHLIVCKDVYYSFADNGLI
jgi:DNA repair protein RadC